MRKRLLAMFVLLMLALGAASLSAQTAFAADYTTADTSSINYGKWKTKNGKTRFVTSTGTKLKGMHTIDGVQYYFNTSGVLQTSQWITYNNTKYYAGKDGAIQKNTWIDKKWYVTETGERAKGLTQIGEKLYFFDLKSGKLKKNVKLQISGNVYYAGTNGVIAQGKFVTIKGYRYYAQADGTFASGLNEIGKHIYFFNRKTHRMIHDKKKKVNGYYYYFQSNGRAARSTWILIGSDYYYFQEDGRMATGVVTSDGWYVGDDGVRSGKKVKAGGVTEINGKYYIYDKSYSLVINKWVTIGKKIYYTGSDGAVLTGLQTIGDSQYYFNKKGVLQKDTVVTIGGTVYVISASGKIADVAAYSGQAIAAYGQTFVGNPYVYGGISLTNGADCSGFVYSIFLKFGTKVLRTADQQMKGPSSEQVKQGYKAGTVIKDSDLLPGDLVFYGTSSYASHVAIYIGNNKVVHAANSRLGIIVSDIDYVNGRVKNKNMRYWA